MQPFENCADVSERGIRVPIINGPIQGRFLFNFLDRFPSHRWDDYLKMLPLDEADKKAAMRMIDVPDYATV